MRLHPGPGVLALAIGLSAAPLEAALATEVAVTVEGVESAGGTLRVTLCLESEYESWGCALRQRMDAAVGGGTLVFEVPAGRYAVKAYHDADDDGELDRDLFGAPSEDYGFSRDARGTFGPPDFADAAVTIGDTPVALTVRIR